jgi:hypothetical protein
MLPDKDIHKVLWVINSILISIATQAHQLTKRAEAHALVGVAHTRAVVEGTCLFLVHPDQLSLGCLEVGEEHVVLGGDEEKHVPWEKVWQVGEDLEGVQ